MPKAQNPRISTRRIAELAAARLLDIPTELNRLLNIQLGCYAAWEASDKSLKAFAYLRAYQWCVKTRMQLAKWLPTGAEEAQPLSAPTQQQPEIQPVSHQETLSVEASLPQPEENALEGMALSANAPFAPPIIPPTPLQPPLLNRAQRRALEKQQRKGPGAKGKVPVD